DPSGAYRLFGSRGTRVAPLALTGPDRFGFLVAHGYDGDSYASSAAVEFYVDGTVSTVDLPSKISFWTTDDGNLTRTEKMVIKNDGSVGIGTASPAALLEVSSTTSGVLIPRVTLVQRNAIVAPVTSELVFQTDNTPGYYYWDGAAWVQLLTASGTGSGWATTGNAGTTVGTNFLGTTDAQDFAIYTNNTEKLRIASAGNVGIGTISPIAKLDIASGDMHLSATQSIWAGILGTNEGRIEYYDGVSGDMTISTTWAGGNSDIIISPDNNTLFTTGNVAVSTGNVGIGTLSPLEDLHIEGATRVDMRFHDADELLDEKIWDYSTGVVGAKTFAFVTRDDAGVFGQTVWQAVRSGTNVSSVSFPNGNVGIGTTAPTDNLHIDRTDVNATITLDATSTGPNVASAIQHKRAGSLRWWVGASGNGGVDDYEWFRYDNTGGFLGTAMTIQRTTGNVGIGSTAPTSQLYISRGTGVAPHAFAQLTIEDDANNMINILSPITGLGYLAFGDAGDAYIGGVVYDHNDNSIDLVANNATRLSVTSAGNVGIGTVSPQGALDVVSTTGALIVPRMTTVQRDALTAVNGMIIYNITTNQFNFREGGVWVLK
ncbi:MAG: hypothetical protein JKY18_13240, partial [Flavobacteriales bacterium]|nr:hypothetical protein [Flavobacteriales bacterium]